MKCLYRVGKQQNMLLKVSGIFLHIYGTYCQKKLNLWPQYLYSEILAKLGLKRNAIGNDALSNLLYT